MILGINHVQLTMPFGEEPTARQFYGELLGLTELQKPEHLKANGGVWFSIGDLQLHLGCEALSNRQISKAHVALNVTSAEHWRVVFTQHSVPIVENAQIEGYKRFDIRDPFGNRIEIMERVTN